MINMRLTVLSVILSVITLGLVVAAWQQSVYFLCMALGLLWGHISMRAFMERND